MKHICGSKDLVIDEHQAVVTFVRIDRCQHGRVLRPARAPG
jgi:hypothetical protein